MIELTNEFKMFLGRGMYAECCKLTLIKIKELMLYKINKVNRTFYSEKFDEIISEYLSLNKDKEELVKKLISLQIENEGEDQVERLSLLMEMYSEVEES